MAVQVITVSLAMAQLFCAALAIDLKVGLYNYIPDLGNDSLATYKAMVEKGFETVNPQHTVTVADPGFSKGGFQ